MAEEDKYEVLEKIGHGSFGVIRKVRRKEDGQVLCRKEISYLRMSAKEREQLQAELSILKELRHPNIVQYYEREHLRASQDLHLYMEYCGNGDLGRVIKNLKQNNQYAEENFVWSVFAQLVSALYRCHYGQDPPEIGHDIMGLGNTAKPLKAKAAQYMILHRDLKPENVFLDEHNSVKLGDFGLSKILQSHDFASTYVGTPFYMSPEICGAERYTLHSDIWSLGCIIYELCAKEPPFNAKTHLELIQKIKAGKVARIPHVYSPELQRTIDICLQVNPNNRPDTAQLLNLPMTKLMRKEQEVVYMSKRMKLEKDRATRALKELTDKIARIERENGQVREEVNASLQKEWEVKARLEIDRQVQLEVQRLESVFEEEVQKRIAAEVARQVEERLQSQQSAANLPVRSSTPTMSLEDERAISTNDMAHAQSQGTLGSPSDFPSQTDLSSLSIDSPAEVAQKPNFKPMQRPSRTPFTRAKTMFQQGAAAVASPSDVQMADPSPMSVGALSLSPRRLGPRKNLFAPSNAEHRWQPTLPPSIADLPDSDVEDNLDGPDHDDDLPTLPSPTRPHSAAAPRNAATNDPFNPTTTRPILKPSQPRAPSAPTLGGARVRTQSAVNVVSGTSPARRRQSKVPSFTDGGSPTRKVFSIPGAGIGATAPTASSALKSRKMAIDELRRPQGVAQKTQGRTLVELAQGRVGVDGEERERESSSPKKMGRGGAAEWDPERDEMPSPFLVRGSKTGGRGILPVR